MACPSESLFAIADMPSRAMEEAVSNPKPNRTPTGYICPSLVIQACDWEKDVSLTFHGRFTKVIIGPMMRIVRVRCCSLSRSSCSAAESPWDASRCLSRLLRLRIWTRITVFASPTMKRNEPLTAAPTSSCVSSNPHAQNEWTNRQYPLLLLPWSFSQIHRMRSRLRLSVNGGLRA